jgi:uncharacterized membrane protein YfhO
MAYFVIVVLLTIILSISSLIGIVEYFRKGKEGHLVSLILLILLSQFGIYAGRFEYLFNFVPVIGSLLLILLTLIFLIVKKSFFPSKLLLLLLGIIFLLMPIVQLFVENNIRLIAIKKYGVEPQHLDIDFQRDEACRYSHAIVHKGKNTYYWSFEKNDFL